MTEKTYEELVAELRAIIEQIEDGQTGLDESIRFYEKGAALIRECEAILEEAELKISEINRE